MVCLVFTLVNTANEEERKRIKTFDTFRESLKFL